MTRVWLTAWEWECCGEPFAVGDHIDFGIASRTPGSWLAEALGSELADTVDAIESHHEHEFADRICGVVDAIASVSQEFARQRVLRRPGHGAPSDAVPPAEGEEWPDLRRSLGNDVFVGVRPSRYIEVSETVPGSGMLHPSPAVRRRTACGSTLEDLPTGLQGRAFTGWLVDVREDAG